MKTLTFIGNGNMALAIAKGVVGKFDFEVVGRNEEKLKKFQTKGGGVTKYHLLENFDISNKNIVLAVKPNNLQEVGEKLQGKANVIYSVLAGTPIEKIKKHIQSDAVVRAMPNLAASLQASMTTLTGDEAYKKEALEIFNTIGETLWLGSEKELDIATALAGSGPAYLALIAEALSDGAVKQGLKRADANKITEGLFGGFAKLLQTTHPALLKDSVMSPGGTTAAGYAALEEAGVRNGCIKAVEAAYKQAEALG